MTSSAHIPLRRCIVSGKIQPKSAMIRFVLRQGRLCPDYAETAPGRGVWMRANAKNLKIAIKKGLFAKGFRRSVTVEEGWVERVKSGLEEYGFYLFVKGFNSGCVRLAQTPDRLALGLLEPSEVTSARTSSIPRFRVFSQRRLASVLKTTAITAATIKPSKLGHALCAKLSLLSAFSEPS